MLKRSCWKSLAVSKHLALAALGARSQRRPLVYLSKNLYASLSQILSWHLHCVWEARVKMRHFQIKEHVRLYSSVVLCSSWQGLMLLSVICDSLLPDNSCKTKSFGPAASIPALSWTLFLPVQQLFNSFYFHTPAGSWQEKHNTCGLSRGFVCFQRIFWRLDLDNPELSWLLTRLLVADPTVDTLSQGFISSSAVRQHFPIMSDTAWNHHW